MAKIYLVVEENNDYCESGCGNYSKSVISAHLSEKSASDKIGQLAPTRWGFQSYNPFSIDEVDIEN